MNKEIHYNDKKKKKQPTDSTLTLVFNHFLSLLQVNFLHNTLSEYKMHIVHVTTTNNQSQTFYKS